jgi:hypothetical protein
MKTGVLVLGVALMLFCALAAAQRGVIGAAVTGPGPSKPGTLRNLAPNPDEQLRVFYQGPDGALATTWAVGSWSAPASITPPGAGRPNSPIAATTNVEYGTFHAYYVGPDGALATTWAAGPWQTPFPITRPGAGRPGTPIAVALRRDAVHVFFIRPDNAVATTWSERGSHVWRPPIAITPPGAGSASASIAAVSRR